MRYTDLFDFMDAMFSMDPISSSYYDSYTVPNYPPSEVVQLKDGTVKIRLSLNKFKKEDIEIKTGENKITVKTVDDYKEPKIEENVLWQKSSFKTKPFNSYFTIPETKFKFDEITAKFEDGILELTVPPKEKKEVRKISII